LSWSSLLGGAIGGIASWLFVDFITRPIRHFRQMRAEIFERIQYYGNLPVRERGTILEDNEGERAEEAMKNLRQLGVQMLSFAATETTAMWLSQRRGYNPKDASHSLIAYSGTIMISIVFRAELKRGGRSEPRVIPQNEDPARACDLEGARSGVSGTLMTGLG
jgi:hypothetical protein